MNSKINVKILGSGFYLPEDIVLNSDIKPLSPVPAEWAEKVIGIKERRHAKEKSTVDMAVYASKRAAENAGIELDEIELFIGASAAPHQTIPCTAALVKAALGMTVSSSPCFDINATCMSFPVAMIQAAALISQGFYRHILIFSSEKPSTSLNPKEPESMFLFGDAAAAIILTRSQEKEGYIQKADFQTYVEGIKLAEIRGGGTGFHPNRSSTLPEMNMFHMEGTKIYKLANRQGYKFLNDFFEKIQWGKTDLDAVVPHQSSGPGLAQMTKRFGFKDYQMINNFSNRGNCVAASIPLALAEAIESKRIQRGHKCLLVGTGAGLTFGALTFIY